MRTFSFFFICYRFLFIQQIPVLVLSCSKGFMDSNLLGNKAEQIPNNGGTLTTLAELGKDTKWVLTPSGCSNGIITQVKLGIDIRSVSGNRNQYPSIETWSRHAGNILTLISSHRIHLTPDNFTYNGVYHYTFPTPISLGKHYKIGIYQPADEKSVVRVYRITGSSNVDRVRDSAVNDLTLRLSGNDATRDVDSSPYRVLILPVTEPSNCFSGFVTENDITSNSQSITGVIRVTDTRVFPDISITCDGIITSWLVGTSSTTQNNSFPLVQLRHSSALHTVLTVDTNNGVLVDTNVYQFMPVNPVQVKAGDILVINSTGSSPMYYQQFNGPPNYEIISNNQMSLLPANDYPLISLVIVRTTGTIATTSTGNIPVHAVTSTLVVMSTSSAFTSGIIKPTSTTSRSVLITSQVSSLTTPRDLNNIINSSNIMIAAIVSTLIVVFVLGGITLALTVLMYTRKWNNQTNSINKTDINPLNTTNFENKVYGAEEYIQDPLVPVLKQNQQTQFERSRQPSTEIDKPLYHVIEMNADIQANIDNQSYEEVTAILQGAYSLLEESEFFPEEQLYWEPGSDSTNLYKQFTNKRYRDVTHNCIQLSKQLGEGQFGVVHLGVWDTQVNGEINVAVKTLKNKTSEKEKVKFLQEAAIMGKFHHPNVVKLHGVVTIGEPTMILLEFVSGGDLREYLLRLQPSPGELVQATVPSTLLNFCRQVAAGMDYLSRKRFVHRDLAARNILVTEQSICKISDFGMSRDVQNDTYYMTGSDKIPIKWTAPEALQYRKYTTASDVWSYGIVLYEIWSLGHKPYESYTNEQYMRLVESGYRLPPPGCSKHIYKIMIQCWHPQPNNRPSFLQLIGSLNLGDDVLLRVSNSTVLGGPLEDGHSLYTDLQNTYKK